MPYEVYKVLHLIFLLIFVASIGISFFLDAQNKQVRLAGMVSSFLMFVAGFGLMARLGLTHEWPLWVKIKVVLWLILATAGPILAKRLKQNRAWAFRGLMILFFVAIVLAIYKPS